MKIYNDIVYSAESNLQQLDVYTCNESDSLVPVIIHIHGGAWCYGDKSESAPHGKFYSEKGFLVVCINYRLCSPKPPFIKHPTQAKDCAAAVAWVFKNIEKYGGDNKQIFVSGHSSGAHLASLIATDERYLNKYNISPHDIKGVIAVDTSAFNLNSYSYIDDTANEQMQAMKDLVQNIFSNDEEQLLDASPIKYADKQTCNRFLIIVSSNRPLAVTVSGNFVKHLKKFGKDASLMQVDIFDHEEVNSAMHKDNSQVSASILKFLKY